ncbi:hypothetical protein F2P81_001137 [Scophthalmus maximus]|uniref:Choline transporter-like protein n=1 Tax=Scophthalmus maximus TaxID=52904 RepID=A0A6A4TWG7_SCOMX|nr:hypothetical protein F2P81_001137 [Scophthalmus maximus]
MVPSDSSHQSVMVPSDASHQSVMVPFDASHQFIMVPSDASHQSVMVPSDASHQFIMVPSDASHQSVMVSSDASHESVMVPSDASHQSVMIPFDPSHQFIMVPSDASHHSVMVPSDASHQFIMVPSDASHQSVMVPSDASHQLIMVPSDASHQSVMVPSDASHHSVMVPSDASHHSVMVPSDASHQSVMVPSDASHQSVMVPSDASHQSVMMCVSQCPDKFATYTEMQLQHKLGKSYWDYYRQFCKPGFNNPDKPVSQVLRDEDCPSMIIPSRPSYGRRMNQKRLLCMLNPLYSLQPADRGLLISLAVSLVFILLLRFTAGWLLWTTIISVVLLLAYVVTFLLLTLCISCWAVTAVYLASSGEAIYKVTSPDVSCPYTNSTCNPETFNRTNISTSALCLGSQCLFAFYGGETSYHRHLPLLQLSNLLVFLWLVNFSLALEQCTLAGTFASYYWAKRKPQDIPACPLFSSFSRAVRYHTGSLAFGALILSVVQLLRIILEFLEQKLKGLDNSLSRFLMCCLKCCFWCLDKFIRYMNHNAYIMVAIYGQNFCTSAREAFFLLMRNVVRVAVLDRVTDFLLFLGKVLIAGGVGESPTVVLHVTVSTCHWKVMYQKKSLTYYNTVVTGAYLIAHGFFSVYAMCVDTLFLCFSFSLKERNYRVRHLMTLENNIEIIRSFSTSGGEVT